MQKHCGEFFQEVVAVYSYFAASSMQQSNKFPQSIRLMDYYELYDNIAHSKFDTQLIKDILIYLLNSYLTYHKFKSQLSCLGILKEELFKQNRDDILEKYYAPLAFSEYAYSQEDEQFNPSDYLNKQFCKLKLPQKFNILLFYITRIMNGEKGNLSKIQNGYENQILCLGNNQKSVYFFLKCLPWAVFELTNKKWKELSMTQAEEKMNKMLKDTQSYSNLFLIKNMLFVMQNYACNKKPNKRQAPIHKVRNPHEEGELVKTIRSRFQDVLKRYKAYIKMIDQSYEHAPPQTADKLDTLLKKSDNFPSLLQFFTLFYNTLKKGVYIRNPQSTSSSDEYVRKFIIWANLFYSSIKLNSKEKKSVNISSWAKYLIENEDIINYQPMIELIVCFCESRVLTLEIKQQNYFLKMSRKKSSKVDMEIALQKSESDLSDLSQENTLDEHNQPRKVRTSQTRMQMRTRNKKFGVTIIDSDDEYSSIKKKLRSFEYQP